MRSNIWESLRKKHAFQQQKSKYTETLCLEPTTFCSGPTTFYPRLTTFYPRHSTHDPRLLASPVKVRVLFDSGSQRSYVTSSLKSRLGPSTRKRETVHSNTFGEEQFKKQSCEMVELGIQGLDGVFTIEVRALAFPVICSPVATLWFNVPYRYHW
jgi:hypothetical protein